MRVLLDYFLEEIEINLAVDIKEDDNVPYKVGFSGNGFEVWVNESDLNALIKGLQKLKKIRKTKSLL